MDETMQIPFIGTVTKDKSLDWLYSVPLPVKLVGNDTIQIVLEGYDDDLNKEAFHAAIKAFLSIGPEVLKAAEPHIFHYYQDMNRYWAPSDEEYVRIDKP